jgi:hypothetical protein
LHHDPGKTDGQAAERVNGRKAIPPNDKITITGASYPKTITSIYAVD